MNRPVGIDFGTTNSVISVMEGSEPVVIPNNRGDRLTPSVVSFCKDGQILVGVSAKNQSIINHERTVTSIKREFGTNYKIKIDDKEYSAPDIGAMIIRRLKEDAEEFLGEPVTSAIITVPAYFNDNQRQDVKKAGELAGLKALRLINEPTAAALAFGLPRNKEGLILMFDLGGGTFDVSALDVSGTVYEVVATSGNNRLGGDDFDSCLVEHICSDFFSCNGVDLREDRMALQKIRECAEMVKKELSEAMVSRVSVPFISADKNGPKHLEMEITREQFEAIIRPYVQEMAALVDRTLADAAVSMEQIDAVVLVGGSTRIPAIGKMLEEKFGNRVLRNVNPDESVATGAAVQAGIMSGAVRGMVLVDVTPLTLGIEADNDTFAQIIARNSCIPISRSRIFTTVADNQQSVEVHVLQGERMQASKNHSLGKFNLTGIQPCVKGVPRIEVNFDIDVNGIVNVSARDLASGKMQSIEISSTRDINDDMVREIIQDASKNTMEDELFLERGRLVKQAQSLLFRLKEKMELEGPEALEAYPELSEIVVYIESALNDGDVEQVRNAVETMQTYLSESAEISGL